MRLAIHLEQNRRAGRRVAIVATLLTLAVAATLTACGNVSVVLTPAPAVTATLTTTSTLAPTLTPIPPTFTPTPWPTPALSPSTGLGVNPAEGPIVSARAAEWLQRAETAKRNGDYATVVAACKNALAASPSSDQAEEAQVRLGEAYLLDENYKAAIAALEDFRASHPQSPREPQATFFLATARQAVAGCSEAIPYYLAYRSAKPLLAGYVDARIGDCRISLGDTARAIESYQSALKDDLPPSTAASIAGKIGDAYIKLGQFDEAVVWYDKARDRAADAATQSDMQYKAALALLKAGKTAEANARLLDIITRYPRSSAALPALKKAMDAGEKIDAYQRGQVYYYARTYDDAVTALRKALAAQDDPKARYLLGLAYKRLGNTASAIANFDLLVKAFPNSPQARDAVWEKAKVLSDQGEHDKAATAWHRFAELYPQDKDAGEAILREGLSSYRLGKTMQAATAWRKLEAVTFAAPIRAEAFFWLAKVLAASGKSDEAAMFLDKAVSADPSGYYGLRARDVKLGQDPAKGAASSYNWSGHLKTGVSDETVDKSQAEAWLATWTPATDQGLDQSDVNLQRGEELLAIGLNTEAKSEFGIVIARHTHDQRGLYQLMLLLRDRGQYRQAILAADTLYRSSPTKSLAEAPLFLQRLLYPDYYGDLVEAESKAQGTDPLLILAMIRQESTFETEATSSAQARGLLQVTVSTGTGIAQRLGISNFDSRDLYRPYISIKFGTWYLAHQIKSFDGSVLLGLAAYNAGPGNVQRWVKGTSVDDLDVFVENIPLTETQTYVKRVYEQYAAYQAVYGEGSLPAP